jgi:hypothetical protein
MTVGQFWEGKENPDKLSLDIPFRYMEKESYQAVFKLLNDLDDRVMDEAVANGQLWFRQAVTRESLKFPHTRTIRPPSNPELYKPSFRPTLYRSDGKISAQVYDKDGNIDNEFKIENIRGCEVMMVLQCTSVWLSAGKFGLTWKVLKMRVYPGSSIQSMRVLPSDAVSFRDVNAQNITFRQGRPATGGEGKFDGKMVYVSHDSKALVVRTPKMYCPWGVQVFPGSQDAKPYIELSFRDAENDSDVRAFKEFIQALDTRVRLEMDREGWFRPPSGNGAVPLYGSILNQKDPQYPAVMKASFQLEHGQITAPIVTVSGTPFGLHELDRRLKGAAVSVVLQCTGVWSSGAKCGVSFRALEVVAQPAPTAMD